jgi:hypothetical protein
MNKDTIIQQCVNILKREDVKHELNLLITPIMEVILERLNPYIYISLIFVIISFLLHLGIFSLLFRNKLLSKCI